MIQIEVILNIIYYRACHMFLRKEIIYMTQIRAPFRDVDIYPNGVVFFKATTIYSTTPEKGKQSMTQMIVTFRDASTYIWSYFHT